jgi:hypothetical protein
VEAREQAALRQSLQHTERERAAADPPAGEAQRGARRRVDLRDDRLHPHVVDPLQGLGIGIFQQEPVEAAQIVAV